MSVLFRAGYDCARDGDLAIVLTETGGGGATGTATLSARYMPDLNLTTVNQVSRQGVTTTYSLGYVSAVAALKAALEVIGAATYTVTLNTTTLRWTIAGSGGGVTGFTLNFNAAAARYFGFDAGVTVSALTHAGKRNAYFILAGTLGGVKDLMRPKEMTEDLAVDLISADGNVEGLAQDGSTQIFEMTFPLEPMAVVWHANAVVTAPWTWELAFKHCRNIEPFHVIDSASGGFTYVGRLRADGCAFDPILQSEDYFAYADIKIAAHYIGTP